MQFIIHKYCFELFLSAHFFFLRNSLLESDVCRIHVKLKLSNASLGRSRINVKVETRSTFTFTRGLSYIATILFTRAKFTCVCT